jgi:hypothetical protein
MWRGPVGKLTSAKFGTRFGLHFQDGRTRQYQQLVKFNVFLKNKSFPFFIVILNDKAKFLEGHSSMEKKLPVPEGEHTLFGKSSTCKKEPISKNGRF